MKTWFSTDGYKRIRLYSKHHKKRVNRTIHLLVAEAFLNGGKYSIYNNHLQVNHKDGVKSNNNVNNLELVNGTENVNHAHDNGLYTFNLSIKLYDVTTGNNMIFRSLRDLSKFLKLSMNYIRPRIPISQRYPINNKYRLEIDVDNYIKHISKIKNNKRVYVRDHTKNKYYILTSYVQISILFGISYIDVARKMIKYPDKEYYIGGYTFSLNELDIIKISNKDKFKASMDKTDIWLKLMNYKCNDVRLK